MPNLQFTKKIVNCSGGRCQTTLFCGEIEKHKRFADDVQFWAHISDAISFDFVLSDDQIRVVLSNPELFTPKVKSFELNNEEPEDITHLYIRPAGGSSGSSITKI